MKLHPVTIEFGVTRELELGTGWFGVDVTPTPERNVLMHIELEPGQGKIPLEMSPPDALQIIEALTKAVYVAIDPSDQDDVAIEQWNAKHGVPG